MKVLLSAGVQGVVQYGVVAALEGQLSSSIMNLKSLVFKCGLPKARPEAILIFNSFFSVSSTSIVAIGN